MRWGISLDERIEAAPQASASCPGCGGELVPKCGKVKVWHWAHKSNQDCDIWYEPEGAWHREWKGCAPKERQEVVMGPHRADVVTADGVVVELQHSPISLREVADREGYYRRMVWIFDAREFVPRLTFSRKPGHFTFSWTAPRLSIASATMPQFWDLGGFVFRPRRLLTDDQAARAGARLGGWGHLLSRDQVRASLGGQPYDGPSGHLGDEDSAWEALCALSERTARHHQQMLALARGAQATMLAARDQLAQLRDRWAEQQHAPAEVREVVAEIWRLLQDLPAA